MKKFKFLVILLALLAAGLAVFAQSQPGQKPTKRSGPPMMMCPIMNKGEGQPMMGNMQEMMQGMPQRMAGMLSLLAEEISARLTRIFLVGRDPGDAPDHLDPLHHGCNCAQERGGCGWHSTLEDGREVPDTLDALFEYDGFHVNMASTFNNASTAEQGMQFLGTDGSLTLLGGSLSVAQEDHREGYAYAIDSWPKALQEQFWNEGQHRSEGKPPLRTEGSVSYRANEGNVPVVLHLLEFFDCVRSRKECSENAEVGHRAAAAGHMVNISYRSGKKVFWDAATGTARA